MHDTTTKGGLVAHLRALHWIPTGSPLYDVYALNAPDSEQQLIGTLYTNSAIVPSMYGDTELFFEHQRMDGPNGDLAYNPQWQQQGLNLQKLCHH